MTFFKTRNFLATGTVLISMSACSSSEIGQSSDVNQETIYQDYRITYDEGNNAGEAEIFTQFRFAGDKGTTLELTKPSKFELDGKLILVDSNGYSGAYYKTVMPLAHIPGKHQLTFTDYSSKKYQNEFSFDSFTLTGVQAAINKQAPAIISFETTPLKDEDYVELTATDTDSTFSVTHSAAEAGNNIIIPLAELKRQKGNSFSITASIYRRIALQQATKEGGKITISHTLKPVKIKLMDNVDDTKKSTFSE
jgi:hypothetical protein